MMNALQLQLIDASLRRQPVLSVYLRLAIDNPRDRRAWRLELEAAMQPVRASRSTAPHNEREGFERAARDVEAALQSIPADVGGATWIAFATPDGIAHAELVPIHVPTLVAWGEGIRIAPYLRVLSEGIPIVVVIGDAAHADLWEYRDGVARMHERVHAHHGAHAPAHMSAGPRPGFHHGTHGTVAHDDVERRRREGTRRMLELACTRALQLAGADGWLLTGGIPHVSSRLARLLAKRAPGRVQEVEGLSVHAGPADITADARAIARRLGGERDRSEIGAVIERDAPAGLGVVGAQETYPMLAHGRVKDLFVSQDFVIRHLDDAEAAVRSARGKGARVVVVAGDTAKRLDAEGGIAARLRYRLSADSPRSA